jgi:DNA repair protein RecN (Recombination protein N)
MIKDIRIQNLATIADLQLSLGTGLNILTGETGAGKSIFLEAFAWLTGLRADRSMIRDGKEYASVEMVLDQIPLSIQEVLMDQGWEDFETLIVFRQIYRTGSSRILLNHRHITVGFLRELFRPLILLHAQNQSVDLMKKSYHPLYLDAYNDYKLQNAIRSYKKQWAFYQETLQVYQTFQSNLISAKEESFLKFQEEELNSANLSEEELHELEEELRVLENGKEIVKRGQQVLDRIHGTDHLIELTEGLQQDLEVLAGYYEKLTPFIPEIAVISESFLEVGATINELVLDLELNPQRLETIENRLQVYFDLTRKYDMNLSGLLIYLRGIQEQLFDFKEAAEKKNELLDNCQKAKSNTEASATLLTQERQRVAQSISTLITEQIQGLEMRDACFEVQVAQRSELNGSGYDEIEFFIRTNLGSTLMPLRKIASGGEASRILLALLICQGESGTTDTMVFDEIDSGLSGKAALRVAEVLNDLGRKHQVICVTHQPQIAAFADHYYQLQKTTDLDQVYTRAVQRTGEERITALSQLVSGEETSRSGHEYAREMINYAEKRKEQIDYEARSNH